MPRATKLKKFKAKLTAGGDADAWVLLSVPFDVKEEFGKKARVSVKGTINGFKYRSSIFPMGDGTHMMMVNKEMQRGAGVGAGSTVQFEMQPDTATRTVQVPAELKAAFAQNPAAHTAYKKLARSRKKEFVDWIIEAKRDETKARRVGKSIEMLVAGRRR